MGTFVQQSNRVAQTNGGGKGDVSRMVVAPALPGDPLGGGTLYTVVWSLYVDAGTTGTYTMESSEIDVFLLAG